MNPFRFEHNIDLIKEQLQDSVQNIQDRLQNNIDFDFGGIINSIIAGVKESILKLGSPSFQNRKARKIVSSDDYNKNIREICNDIKNSYIQANSLLDIIKNNFNYNAISNETLKEEVAELKSRADRLKLTIDSSHDRSIFVARDSFNNSNHISRDETDAHIDNIQGTVSLRRISSYNHNDSNARIIIGDSSNGFIGNLHQVKADHTKRLLWEENIQNRSIVFYGESNPCADIYAIQDQDPTTWFEYEIVNIPDKYKKDPCKNYGFTYLTSDGKEISWARDPSGGKLVLTLKIILPEPKVINWIDINPYIPPFPGSNSVLVKYIKTAPNEKETPKSIYDTEYINYSITENIDGATSNYADNQAIPGKNDFTGHGVFTFSPKLVQVIEIRFEQDTPYDCLIGHIYYERITKIKVTKRGFLGLRTKTSYETRRERIEGPIPYYDSGYADTRRSEGLIGFLEDLWYGIFGGTTKEVVSDVVQKGIEAFEGKRWAIGIRDININSFTYSTQSQVVSGDFVVPGRICKIELEATEQIPELFYSGKSEQTMPHNKDNWIKYYVSLDSGENWYQVALADSPAPDIPSAIYVNADIAPELQDDDALYINADNPDKIRFKAVLSRPTDIEGAEFYSPILHDYSLKLEVSYEGDEE